LAPLCGQTSTTGLVTGTVTDPSGAAVPDAVVELTATQTGRAFKQTTNAAGQFLFANVSPGEYQLKITARGFRVFSVGGLRVEVTL
jgi:protocatechuate 3,4-dioxygenase beta subunit